MKALRQRHQHSCGATVVAMVACVSLDEAERVTGIHLTPTRKLRTALASFGVRTAVRFVPGIEPAAGDIVRIRWHGTPVRHHYAVKVEQGYADPGDGRIVSGFEPRGRVLSVLRACPRVPFVPDASTFPD